MSFYGPIETVRHASRFGQLNGSEQRPAACHSRSSVSSALRRSRHAIGSLARAFRCNKRTFWQGRQSCASVAWATDRVFAELERRRTTLVAVDEPDLPGLFPRLDIVTNPALFYIRFHGRNAKGWRSGNMQKQFDYDYGDAELRKWADVRIARMTQHAASGVIFFNNHVRAQAPRNAVRLINLLIERGLMEVES